MRAPISAVAEVEPLKRQIVPEMRCAICKLGFKAAAAEQILLHLVEKLDRKSF